MKRIAICLAACGLAGGAWPSDSPTAPPRRAPNTVRAVPLTASLVRPAVQLKLSPIVQGALERPDSDLQAAALRGLNMTDRSRLQRVVNYLRANDQSAARAEWEHLLQRVDARTDAPPMDIQALVQWVVRQSYLETNEDLRSYAQRVQHFNAEKQQIQGQLTALRQVRSITSPAASRSGTPREPVVHAERRVPSTLRHRDRTVKLQSLAQRNAYIREWEEKLQTVGDDAQLAQLDMQNALQKQQQTLQMMSQISKQLYDTAMAIIRKIG